jgi:hypothetical protein
MQITHNDVLASAYVSLYDGQVLWVLGIDVVVKGVLGGGEAGVGVVDHGCGVVEGGLGGEVRLVVVHEEGDETFELALLLLGVEGEVWVSWVGFFWWCFF